MVNVVALIDGLVAAGRFLAREFFRALCRLAQGPRDNSTQVLALKLLDGGFGGAVGRGDAAAQLGHIHIAGQRQPGGAQGSLQA
jgi:hypothetical protein